MQAKLQYLKLLKGLKPPEGPKQLNLIYNSTEYVLNHCYMRTCNLMTIIGKYEKIIFIPKLLQIKTPARHCHLIYNSNRIWCVGRASKTPKVWRTPKGLNNLPSLMQYQLNTSCLSDCHANRGQENNTLNQPELCKYSLIIRKNTTEYRYTGTGGVQSRILYF